ncbi:MAG: ATP/GTP-binding protein [Euryarchaeota archaeon]|nr:ATP/GTP-binding protein [Euryarchaeota archaeon]
MDPTIVYLVGTAGSGKSSLAAAYGIWMGQAGHDATLVNLDPGADSLPYVPDVDVRDWISLDEVMASHGLGPNGAQVAAADMIALNATEIAEELEKFRPDTFVIDTPGQIELFAFRSSSLRLIDALGRERAAVLFLLDSNMCRIPNGFASTLMLSATVQFRLNLPCRNVLTKADLLSSADLGEMARWSEEEGALDNALAGNLTDGSALVNIDLLRALRDVAPHKGFIVTSADTLDGMDAIYADVQRLFAGGEEANK